MSASGNGHASGGGNGPGNGRRFGWLKALFRRRNGDTLRDVIEELAVSDHADIDPDEGSEQALLANVLRMSSRTVEDVMVPRPDVVAVEITTPLSELISVISVEAHSRMPVYKENLDNVAGFMHIKDLIGWWDRAESFRLEDIMREVLFVPPSMPVLDLLLEMRQSRVHMAMVVDEFGGVDGLVSIEDVVEEIVGDIRDEHEDEEDLEIVRRADGTVIADARMSLDAFEEAVGQFATPEERDEVETLGGMVFTIADRVPGRGEVLTHDSGVEFEVLDADPRRINKLRIRRLPPGGSDASHAASGK